MKQGWATKKLGEVCNIYNGSTPLRRNKEFWDNGTINWFTIEDIRTQGRKISSTRQKISQKGFEKSSLQLLPPNSVLLCCTASVGEYAISDIELTTNQQFNGLVVKDFNYLLPDYLFHYSSTLKDQLLGVSGKTTIDFVSMTKVKNIDIPIPPLPEQKRIVAKLDQAFSAIDQAKSNVERNLQNAKDLFQNELSDIFDNKGKGWIQKELGQVAVLKGRIGWKGLTAKEYTEQGPLFLSVHSLNYGDYVDYRDAFHISDARYDESPEIMLQKGDVLICKDGAGIGKVGMVGDLYGKTTVNSSLLVIRPKNEIRTKYLYFSLLSSYFQKIVQDRLQGATTPHLYQRDITTFPIYLPPLDAQDAIIEKIEKLNTSCKNLQTNYKIQLSGLDELTKSLLQDAFVGEL